MRVVNLDTFDVRILKTVETDAELQLKEIGKKVGIFSPSAISKRLKSLKHGGYIKRVTAKLDYSKLGFNFMTITFVRAKFSKNYNNLIGHKLQKLPGVVSLYFLLGDIDFVMVTVNRSKEEYEKTLDILMAIEGIERSDTRVVLQTFSEMDFRNVDIVSQR